MIDMKKVGVIAGKNAAKNKNYFAAVECAKGEVVSFDPYKKDQDIAALVHGIDGLLLPGGVDLQPSYYHEENVACGEMDPELDEFEMAVVKEAADADIPILGICRGLQLLNVFFKGSLYQDISCSNCHKRVGEVDRVHLTSVDKDSFLYEIYGKEEISVNSAHHQAIKDIGQGLIPVQYSKEGIIEAFYHEKKPIYGLQWHPERMCLENSRTDTEDGLKIFEFFIGRL